MTGPARGAAAGIAAAVVAMIAIAWGAFLGFPHSADEYAYLYQARTFEAGRVTNPPLPDPVFQPTHVVSEADRTYGKYPPGWPALLALADALDLASVANALVTAAALALAWLLARRGLGVREAHVSLALLATSPFVLLNGASLYAHPLVALLVLAFAGCLWRYADEGRVAWLVGASAALGGVVLTRPFDAAVVALVTAPFALALLWRRPRETSLHALAALPALGVAVGLYLLYNAATTGDPFTPGHVRHDPLDRPALVSYRYWAPSLRRAREYALFGFPIALLPAAAWALWRRAPRGPLLFAVALVGVLWVAYAAYPIDPPPRLGPRYLYLGHWFVGLVLAGALVAAVRRRWHVPLVATIALVQLGTTVLIAVELRTIVRLGSALYVAADALEQALDGERAVVVAAGPSGSVPPQDLPRNDLDVAQPVLFARERARGRTDWQALGLGDRRIYVWDGIGGAPALWTADPGAPVQRVVVLGDRAAVLRKGQGGRGSWLAVFGAADCTPAPYLAVLWQGLYPPDRLSDVQRPYEVRFGPCPGFAAVQRAESVGIPEALPRRLGLNAHFRSFLTVRRTGDTVFALTGAQRAILRVGGVAVAEARDGATRTSVLRLPPGTYPVAVSHYTLWTPPVLRLRVEGPGEQGEDWGLSISAPAGSAFHERLPAEALVR